MPALRAPPVVSRARYGPVAPLVVDTDANEPPARTSPPTSARALTLLPADGAQDVSAPVASETAARRARGWPLTEVKSPPR